MATAKKGTVQSKNSTDFDPLRQSNPEQYRDAEGVSLGKLRFGLWYVKNTPLIRRFGVGILFFVSFSLAIYGIGGIFYYWGFNYAKDQQLIKDELASSINHDYIVLSGPKESIFGPPQVFNPQEGKYDFASEIKNENERFYAMVNYHFVFLGGMTSARSTMILPGEKKHLFALGETLDSAPVGAKLVINSVNWQRMQRHQIPDWPALRQQLLNIEITAPTFVPASGTGLSDQANISQVSFTLANKTVYNYLKADFQVLLYGGGNLMGVYDYPAGPLLSGETRKINFNLAGNYGSVSQVVVVPDIDVMNAGNFLKVNSNETFTSNPALLPYDFQN
ncbi:MAG: hypothetical protein WCK11_01605 [Candidatus Falkowbacteria bacterium]